MAGGHSVSCAIARLARLATTPPDPRVRTSRSTTSGIPRAQGHSPLYRSGPGPDALDPGAPRWLQVRASLERFRVAFDGFFFESRLHEGSPSEVAAARGLQVVSDEGALVAAVDEALAAQPDVLAKIQDGKVQAAGAVIGAVMKAMRGQADAARVREIVLERAAQS